MYEEHIQEALEIVSAWDDFETEEAFLAAVHNQALLMSGLDTFSHYPTQH